MVIDKQPSWASSALSLAMAIPGFLVLQQALSGAVDPADLLHFTGELSARLLLIALALTPLRLLFPRARWLLWMSQHRRHLGVAAFGYAALHTLLYLIDMETLKNVLAEIGAVGIWTGWVALAIFLPLAVTSNQAAVRLLGKNWKLLHRAVYFAAALTLAHWVTIHNNAVAGWVHFAPLILLEIYRVLYVRSGKQEKAAT